MTQPDSPLKRPLKVPNFVRWLIAVIIVIALGMAVATRSYGLAVIGLLFVVVAVALARREGI